MTGAVPADGTSGQVWMDVLPSVADGMIWRPLHSKRAWRHPLSKGAAAAGTPGSPGPSFAGAHYCMSNGNRELMKGARCFS